MVQSLMKPRMLRKRYRFTLFTTHQRNMSDHQARVAQTKMTKAELWKMCSSCCVGITFRFDFLVKSGILEAVCNIYLFQNLVPSKKIAGTFPR